MAAVGIGVLALAAVAMAGTAEAQEEWHCPWTAPDWGGDGWVGEFDGNQQTSVSWSSAPYTATRVCVRTAVGITYTDIEPAQSGTIVSDDPIVAFSLYKVTEIVTTTSTTAPTTTVPETTTTTEQVTTTVPETSTTPTTAPGETTTPCVDYNPDTPECDHPATGGDDGLWYVVAGTAVAMCIAGWLLSAAARKQRA